MHDCDKYRSFLSDYLEGELLPDIRKEVESHLHVCSDCSEIAYQVKIICESLSHLPQVSTSPNFEARLQAQIGHIKPSRFPVIPVLTENWKIPAVGSVVLLATIGMFIVLNPSKSKVAGTTTISSSNFAPASVQIPGKGNQLNQSTSLSGGNQPAFLDSTGKDTAGYGNQDGLKLVGDR